MCNVIIPKISIINNEVLTSISTWYFYHIRNFFIMQYFLHIFVFLQKVHICCRRSVQDIENLAQSYQRYQCFEINHFIWKVYRTMRIPSKAYNFLQGALKRAIFISIVKSEQYVGFQTICSKYWWNQLHNYCKIILAENVWKFWAMLF